MMQYEINRGPLNVLCFLSWDSVDGIAIAYRVDGLEFITQWGQQIFFSPRQSRPVLRPT
jgi:hypothetical protein